MSKALTLSGLMALLLPKERLFVIHHLGADISEAVAGGTVEELERTRCVEVCGNNIVERIAVDVDDWPDTPAPILLVTIGGKVKVSVTCFNASAMLPYPPVCRMLGRTSSNTHRSNRSAAGNLLWTMRR